MAFFSTGKPNRSIRNEVHLVVRILIRYLDAFGEFIKVSWLDVHLPAGTEFVCISESDIPARR